LQLLHLFPEFRNQNLGSLRRSFESPVLVAPQLAQINTSHKDILSHDKSNLFSSI
jgi:hypothetical protein